MAGSIPSSVTGFSHRQTRANSATSFNYFQEPEGSIEWPQDEAIRDESDEELENHVLPEDESDVRSPSPERRKLSGHPRGSVEDPLLHRYGSHRMDDSYDQREGRMNQKIYLTTEDLTVVVAGFRTKLLNYAFYIILCIMTMGFLFLVFRWYPHWRVRLIGIPKPLRDCDWVVVEVIVRLVPLQNLP